MMFSHTARLTNVTRNIDQTTDFFLLVVFTKNLFVKVKQVQIKSHTRCKTLPAYIKLKKCNATWLIHHSHLPIPEHYASDLQIPEDYVSEKHIEAIGFGQTLNKGSSARHSSRRIKQHILYETVGYLDRKSVYIGRLYTYL